MSRNCIQHMLVDIVDPIIVMVVPNLYHAAENIVDDHPVPELCQRACNGCVSLLDNATEVCNFLRRVRIELG